MDEKTASEQIDAIIAKTDDWKGKKLAQLRSVIRSADPSVVEEVKWKKASKPEGIAVWAANGNLCFADILKNAVRLTFPKGARLVDDNHFTARLDSKTMRAIDFNETDSVDEAWLKQCITDAVVLNQEK